MKKLLLTLIVLIALGESVFAQGSFEWYWPKPMNGSSGQAALCAAIAIDGHVFTVDDEGWDQLEVAAFTGEVIRARDVLDRDNVDWYDDPYPITKGTAVQYDQAGVEVSFKLYNHVNGVVYDCFEVTYQGNPMTILTGQDHTEAWAVPPYDPIIINFISTFTKHIDGYNGGDGGYYLIASPIAAEVTPSEENGFITDEYDLYYFDQESSDEWINYKVGEGFNLTNGKGYLYASNQSTDLVFTGAPYNGDGVVALDYFSGNEFTGWNLIGNPFSDTAFIDCSFYRMNEEGTELDPGSAGGKVEPMEGVFVETTEEGQSVTFSLEGAKAIPTLALNVVESRGNVVDRAIVNFSGEHSLPKFQLNPSHTKVFFPQESLDYAVISAGEMGEIPVGFKAEKNGSYTLSYTSEEVSFAYLHLIDNKTGMETDLLAHPSYSFDAQTTDYTSRFKLVFATGSNDEDSFAFNNNGNWIISNDGVATLQVIDVTGRILSSETISGSCSKAISAAPGVYMLRLINGDNMKVQKVVVK